MAAAKDTREKILRTAAALVRSGGLGSLTFDAVARRLGVSKQAVLYWFPKKEDLIAAVAIPWIRDEARAALAAVEGAPDTAAAVRAFVRDVAEFHFADMDRFRLLYIAPQSGARPIRMTERLGEQVHPLTATIYDALEERLATRSNVSRIEARRQAVAIHVAVLGLVMMVSMTEAMGDPLRHDRSDLVDALADLLSR